MPVGPAGAWSRSRDNIDYRHPMHGAPDALALSVREKLGLGDGPIASMQEEVLEPLDVLVLTEKLAPSIDAFSCATAATGAVIVLNVDGHHARTAFGRRVTLAHELCHVLFDRSRMRTVSRFCRISIEKAHPKKRHEFYEIERRARAFAVSLLAPLGSVKRAWLQMAGNPLHVRVRGLMETFGLGYEAMRSQLHNAGVLSLGEDILGVPVKVPPQWEQQDALPLRANVALQVIRPQRRGPLLDRLVEASSRGLLTETAVRGTLRVRPDEWEPVRDTLQSSMGLGGPVGWTTSSSLKE